MKVALVTSDQEVMGVEYLSAAAKQRGHEVRLFFDPQMDHAGLLFLAGLKLGRNEYTKYIQMAFSKKNVP